ncbi:DNA-processing protein DprA [Oerskovia sp. NPDC056781]|uniref:DNA-processing protein DprA n=1 Tax=Oerskovia sp. NPDC056781 TaxID=3345942 RepID=UPI003670FCBE
MAEPGPAFDLGDPVLARAAWSRIAEPGDPVAGALVAHLGAGDALAWLYDAASGTSPLVPRRLEQHPERPSVGRVQRAVERWRGRLATLDPGRELRALDRLGGALLVPGDPRWPTAVDDLGDAAPLALWVRGETDLGGLARRSVALVGARACTEYGRHVAADLASGLVDRRFTIVSGGAYGIDAAAHRGAIAARGRTVAFLAGGVDRLYPAGNTELLRAVLDEGSIVSEVPPGSVPSRVRFLQRNRLIAAFSRATVVVEAAWRSGALSTATHATALLRPVGAVPGPVTSMASGGCHQLLRDAKAVCVTDVDEAAELAGHVGTDASTPRAGRPAPQDDLDELGRRLWDALPLRAHAAVDSVARAAGLGLDETLGGLGHLELAGLAEQSGGRWRRAARPPRRVGSTVRRG